ncbi:hypothetical protein HRbin36_02846 [bacterium HR36]|nr:hypothetical protein HRbin36_02846 [bacterium HR36]
MRIGGTSKLGAASCSGFVYGLIGIVVAQAGLVCAQSPPSSPPPTQLVPNAVKSNLPPAGKAAEKTADKPAPSKPPVPSTELPRRFTGRPGELEPEEEDRLDALIDRFIEHDLGLRHDPKAVQEFQKLGVEAIPALVRALNRTAPLAQRCPPAMIAKKLISLMQRVEDVEVLDFIRREVGAGVRSGPNIGFLDSVRVNAMLRKRELLSRPPPPTKSLFPAEPQEKPYRSPGEKP